jgi:hypothetical protein
MADRRQHDAGISAVLRTEALVKPRTVRAAEKQRCARLGASAVFGAKA